MGPNNASTTAPRVGFEAVFGGHFGAILESHAVVHRVGGAFANKPK